jgi:hypothetical protein
VRLFFAWRPLAAAVFAAVVLWVLQPRALPTTPPTYATILSISQ